MTIKEQAALRYEELKEQGLADKYGKAGIYSIFIGGKLAYIGKSRDMLSRIASHMVEME